MRKKLLDEYYKNLVKDYTSLLILGFSKIKKEKIIENFISANLTINKPVILAASNNYWIKKVEEENISELSMKGNNILENIKLAMNKNQELLGNGYVPLIIIDDFENIYNKDFDIDALTFYEYVIRKNLSDRQRIIFLSEHIYPTLKREVVFDINENLLFDIDALVISDEYLNNNSNDLKELKMVISDMLDWKFGKRLSKEINQMVENKDPRLDKGIVLDPYELEITGFKI